MNQIKCPEDLIGITEKVSTKQIESNNQFFREFLCYLIENHQFSSPKSIDFSYLYDEEEEYIKFKTSPKKKEIEETKRYLRLRGLPFNKTRQDIMDFLEIQCDPNQILIVLTPDGRPQGEALVELNNEDELKFCLMKDKLYMGSRYIDVVEGNEDQFKYLKQTQQKSTQKQGKTLPNRPSIVRIRGIPFRIKTEELQAYFSDLDLNDDQVKIVMQSDGRPSGDAILILNQNQTPNMVIEKYHKKRMQNRYLEVFEGNDRDYEYISK